MTNSSTETKVISPFKFSGEMEAMTSKSYLQRALAIASLANSSSVLKNVQWSADGLAAADVIQQLGAHVEEGYRTLKITPNPTYSEKVIHLNIGESGLGLRMFSGIAALKDSLVSVSGKGSILERPISPVVESLSQCGVSVDSSNGKLPLQIQGKLKGGKYSVDGSFSSQILTGLLIALPLAEGDTELEVHNLKSIPYIDMTLQLIEHFGVKITHDDYKTFYIKGEQSYQGMEYVVEGDWSGMANHIVGAAISGEVMINGLNEKSLQADRAILKAISQTGADINWKNSCLTVCKNSNLPFQIDATHSPDIFPPLVVLACAAKGISQITGIHRLTHKESDRLTALKETFGKLGVTLTSENDDLLVHGTGTVTGGVIHSFNDHRIAMAACIAACISTEKITIENADAVKKSYPLFFKNLETL